MFPLIRAVVIELNDTLNIETVNLQILKRIIEHGIIKTESEGEIRSYPERIKVAVTDINSFGIVLVIGIAVIDAEVITVGIFGIIEAPCIRKPA